MDVTHRHIILVRLGEITLKGLNRGRFVSQLIRTMRWRTRDLGDFDIEQSHSRIWVRPVGDDVWSDALVDELVDRFTRIFGIVSVSPAVMMEAAPACLDAMIVDYAREALAGHGKTTFKIETRRVNKAYPQSSYEVCCELGDRLLSAFPEQLTVDVEHPDVTFFVEIRDALYLYHDIVEGARGLPVGMSGRGMLLLSGGIDSPVAGYMMASRGMIIDAIYFHTAPYTSPQALKKVETLASLLSRYAGRIRLHVVDFTETQLELNRVCPEDMLTIVMRRMMMRIASKIAETTGAKALITGESLGQVASQTLEGLVATDIVIDRPIFRPLIGVDKNDTIELARKIGTFETSILPYDDCCTVFVSKHPKTHPSLIDAEAAERDLDVDRWVADAVEKTTVTLIHPYRPLA
ncbi:MAG: tRNA uracil 4-sulfurtransferase ThiI [Saccharofermentanales bacterium]|jgi:thiamine biosynthesis protein ThiI